MGKQFFTDLSVKEPMYQAVDEAALDAAEELVALPKRKYIFKNANFFSSLFANLV